MKWPWTRTAPGAGASTHETKYAGFGPLLARAGAHPRWMQRDAATLAREGYEQNPIVHRCVRLIADNAAAVPIVLYRGHGTARTRLVDHPLLNLLRRPNPLQSGNRLIQEFLSYYLISGNAFMERVGPDGRAPVELWVPRSDRMKVIPGRFGLPRGYVFNLGGGEKRWPADEVTGESPILHFRTYHPTDDWYGLAPIAAAAYAVDQHNAASSWNFHMLKNGGRPSGAFVFEPADGAAGLTEEQVAEIKAQIAEENAGAGNAGRHLLLQGGWKYQPLGLSAKDIDWSRGKELSALEIAQVYEVPAPLLHLQGTMTYANFREARLHLYEDAVLPLLKTMLAELNNWLTPRFGDDLSLAYDEDAISALAPRREAVWARVQAADFLTVNEKRDAVGFDPIGGGDVLVAPAPGPGEG